MIYKYWPLVMDDYDRQYSQFFAVPWSRLAGNINLRTRDLCCFLTLGTTKRYTPPNFPDAEKEML